MGADCAGQEFLGQPGRGRVLDPEEVAGLAAYLAALNGAFAKVLSAREIVGA